MAKRVFIEHNGERIDVTDVRPITELTCDACGEFAAVLELATVSIAFQIPGTNGTSRTYNVHVKCMTQLLDSIARTIVEAAARA